MKTVEALKEDQRATKVSAGKRTKKQLQSNRGVAMDPPELQSAEI
jgi:hypothetical protein